jgi:hypothetical protein
MVEAETLRHQASQMLQLMVAAQGEEKAWKRQQEKLLKIINQK